MKRTLLVLAALLCTATTVSANYKAQKTDNKLIITNTNDTNALLILSGYDENGLLKGAQLLKAEDGKYTANEIENASSYRIADSDGFWDVNFITPTPQSTPLPTITPKPTIHPAYEKEKDAIFTIAVVKNISTITYDGDNAYKIDAFTRGTEESCPRWRRYKVRGRNLYV